MSDRNNDFESTERESGDSAEAQFTSPPFTVAQDGEYDEDAAGDVVHDDERPLDDDPDEIVPDEQRTVILEDPADGSTVEGTAESGE